MCIIQAYLIDSAGSVADHHNKANLTTKQVTPIFLLYGKYKFHLHYTVGLLTVKNNIDTLIKK